MTTHTRSQRVAVLSIVALSLLSCAVVALAADAADHDHQIHLPGTTAADSSFFGSLFKSYTPRQACMNYEQSLIWLHVISDAVIAIAYFTIPIALLKFVRRRKDLAFNWMFVCFAIFILACGLTHVLGVIAIWRPYYRLDGVVKAITALASIGTAIALWRLIPAALLLPSPSQLHQANESLGQEVVERKRIEAELRATHDELEQRVRDRTLALTEANAGERAARAEAERAGRTKDEFLATLSHELRTPLNAIYGWAQILRRGNASPDTVIEGVATIERNARAQAQMIDDLLDMSRIISGKIRIEAAPIELSGIVEAAIETAKPTAAAKGIKLVFDASANPSGYVLADASRLQQVFWNLLSNSIKFTPRGGVVEVRIDQAGQLWQVEVIDTGEGIGPEFLPYIFDRFRQADASTTRRHGGLGLGLAIVKQLVELQGGEVRARSDGAGRGTTVTVSLPVNTQSASTAAAGGNEEASMASPSVREGGRYDPALAETLRGTRILVVDDEPDARALLKRLLSDCGCTVLTASDGDEAVILLEQNRPDVLISDIGMPHQDGYELLRRIRQLSADAGGSIPAIALTAYARAEDRMKAVRAGYQMHVPKPVEPAELITMVASLLGRTAR
jgi:signal transduction histidine kinase/ActR/RegA family two-component response regulator